MYSSQQSPQEAYEVEDLLQYKREKGKQYILVWWEGYPKQQATWQPIENLLFIPNFQQIYQNLKFFYDQNKSKKHIKEVKFSKKGRKKLSAKQKDEEQIFEQVDQQQNLSRMGISSVKNGFRYLKQSDRSKKAFMKNHQEKKKNISILQQTKQVDNWQDKIPFVLQQQSSYSQISPQNTMKQINESQNKKLNISSRLIKDINNQDDQIITIEPVRFRIRLKESTKLMFHNEQLSVIKDVCLKNNQILYLVQFNNSAFKDPIYLHEKYLKLLWPRKFAEFLLSKLKL